MSANTATKQPLMVVVHTQFTLTGCGQEEDTQSAESMKEEKKRKTGVCACLGQWPATLAMPYQQQQQRTCGCERKCTIQQYSTDRAVCTGNCERVCLRPPIQTADNWNREQSALSAVCISCATTLSSLTISSFSLSRTHS